MPEPRPEWCVVKGCRERWPCPFHAVPEPPAVVLRTDLRVTDDPAHDFDGPDPFAPEPVADAAWEALGEAVQYVSAHGPIDAAEWDGIERQYRPRIEAALARPTHALDVEALRDAILADELLFHGPPPEGLTEHAELASWHAAELAREYAAILAARATEGRTDR